MDTSVLTFDNSFFYKRGRRIYSDKGLYNPLGEYAEKIKEMYNSLILQEEMHQLLIDAIASDLSKVPPKIYFPPGGNFYIRSDSRLSGLVKYLADTRKAEPFALEIYVLDLFNLRHPEILRKHLPPEPIAGGSRRRTRRMRGGSMPLSYFTDAPRVGSTEPTGVGYGSSSFSNSGWIRAPIDQTGGSRYRSRHPPAFHAVGGFSPSIMGSFASNGLRLLPLAGYVGYNQFKNFGASKKSSNRRSSRSKRRSK